MQLDALSSTHMGRDGSTADGGVECCLYRRANHHHHVRQHLAEQRRAADRCRELDLDITVPGRRLPTSRLGCRQLVQGCRRRRYMCTDWHMHNNLYLTVILCSQQTGYYIRSSNGRSTCKQLRASILLLVVIRYPGMNE